jgi:hypothetical protein
MAEIYLFFSSLMLFAMGCLCLVLSVFLRLKLRQISNIPKNLSANAFNKTFFVFNPFPEYNKIIHRFLVFLPLIVFFAGVGLVVVILKILEYNLLLSTIILIICLNLIVIEITPEIYENTKVFIRAFQVGTKLGVGDVKVFQVVRKALPRLSNYYLGLSLLFMASAVLLSYIWPSIMWLLFWFFALMGEATVETGIVGLVVVIFLYALTIVIIQVFLSKLKDRLFGYVTESLVD